MGKAEEAIKKINEEIQARQEEEVFAKIGEALIDRITTEAAAEAILRKGKSLTKIFEMIRQEAYQKALKTKKGDWAAVWVDEESAMRRILDYFGIPAENPQASAPAAHLLLDDFF